MKRNRSDSASSAVDAMRAVAAGVIDPPAHVHLRPEDRPYWDAVVRARARDSWTDADLILAGNLARCNADIERLQKEIDTEGDVVTNARGTPIVNPRHTLLETLSRRSVALSRMLQVHAQATQGDSRDQAKRATRQREAEVTLQQHDDDLIPRAH